MDAGSFIFEVKGVRWSVDPGNQAYHELEQKIGMDLWNNAQESKRWSLLTKNNFGHSTLTVNGEKHRVDGRVSLVRNDIRSANPEFTFEMTPLYGKALKRAERSFARLSDSLLRIRDELFFSEESKSLSWQLITRADVVMERDRLILRQEGKQLFLSPVLEVPYEVRVVELSPPPLDYDKNIPGLKRIELRVDRESFPGETGSIVVELSTAN
jgi:hypothetical protein